MSDYFAVIEDRVEGPVTMDELIQMERGGHITGESQVSRIAAPDDWFSWSQLTQAVTEVGPAAEAVKPPKQRPISLVRIKIKLRRETAYPGLRNTLTAFIWINVLAGIICGILCFEDSRHLAIYLGIALSSLPAIIAMHIASALLDMVDAALRKDDGSKFHETNR